MTTLIERIETILHKRPTRLTPLHGGMIGQVYRVDLPDGAILVAKVANSLSGTLDIEGYMLRYLTTYSELPVPQVLHSEPSLLLMTYIEGGSNLNPAVQTHAAELLAALHTIDHSAQFGLEEDTLIGALHQPNPLTNRWIDFFREHRLLYMAKVAMQNGPLPQATFERLQMLASQLENYLNEPEAPSLLHGDVWTTNILANNEKITGFVDPAIYYGHAEIELAFTTLFGTFGEPFFQRYNEIRPIEPDFMEVRRDIYNLYPLLVHVRLFGGNYVHAVNRILAGLGF